MKLLAGEWEVMINFYLSFFDSLVKNIMNNKEN